MRESSGLPAALAPKTLASLHEAVGSGAEALLAAARGRLPLGGVAVGILREGEACVRFYGKGVGPDSVFELGSLTKTYTAELLAILVARGTVRLDDPVAKFLPGGEAAHPGPNPVTLLDLATHRSGEPRLPPHLPATNLNPYADYADADLERYLAKRPLQVPTKQEFLYSNLGYSILGYALGRAAGISYAELLQREILDPLGMRQSALALGQPQPNLLRGHMQTGIPASHWTFAACAPCGGLCSTIGDQLKFLAWLLGDCDRLSFQPQALVPGGEVGLGWMLRAGSEICWHNGGTFGFSSYMSLDRKRRTGMVLLSQTSAPQLVTTLGTKLERLLAGQPVEPLKGDYGRNLALALDPLRILIAPFGPVLSPLAHSVALLPRWMRWPTTCVAGYGLGKMIELAIAVAARLLHH
jgi:CubicO group peptidase (beta-lactamase class C family)